MKRWLYAIPILLILPILFAGCSSSSNPELQNYLTQIDSTMEEISDITADLWGIAEKAGPFGVSEPEKVMAEYRAKYNELLSRFSAIEYPSKAVKLRQYTIEIINLHVRMIDTTTNYLKTRDKSYEETFISLEADMELQKDLAADEWDKLSDIAGGNSGWNIGQIILGLIAFGVAASIGMFLLQVILGTGCGLIGLIFSAIGALVDKIKGINKKNLIRVEVTKKGYETHQKSAKRISTNKIMSVLTKNEIHELQSILSKLRDGAMEQLGINNN